MGVILTSVACIFVLPLIYKLYLMLTMKWDRSPTCLVGKTIIVTGSNAGIGFYAAQDFAKRGARVILACRDPKRAIEARSKIMEVTGNPNVVVKLVDLASLSSVRNFAAEINATEARLDVLVNNAGVPSFGDIITDDGLSLLMQTNYFGPYLLTILLIDLLKKSSPSRIVNVASLNAHHAGLDVNQLNRASGGLFGDLNDYARSKLCNILFSNELARKLEGTGISVNSVHPGPVSTDIFRHLPGISGKFVAIIAKLIYRTAQEGAQSLIFAAASKDIHGISGAIFGDCSEGFMPIKARDRQLAKRLWEKSEEAVKLTAEEGVLSGIM